MELQPWDSDTLYANSFGRPVFDYRSLIGNYNLERYVWLNGNAWLPCIFNTGNHFLHKPTFETVVEAASPYRESVVSCGTDDVRRVHDGADSAFYNSRWLLSGRTIEVVQGLEYEHRYGDDNTSAFAGTPPSTEKLPPLYFLEMCRQLRPDLPVPTCPTTQRCNDTNQTWATYGDDRLRISIHRLTVPALGRYITMKELGNYGRFANAMFQYCFCRRYADMHDLTLQTPQWVGTYLFGLTDPPISVDLPRQQEREIENQNTRSAPPEDAEFVNCDFFGFGQQHTSWFFPDMHDIQRRFSPVGAMAERVMSAADALDSRGSTAIGVHLRRGDYGFAHYYCTPIQWVLEWLNEHWQDYLLPVLFVATEDRQAAKALARYNPVFVEDLGVELSPKPYPCDKNAIDDPKVKDPRSIDYYPDFYLLTQCDTLLCSNSSFSIMAAMLNKRAPVCWRPSLPAGRMVRFDPWNTDVLLRDNIEDYPETPGLKGEL